MTKILLLLSLWLAFQTSFAQTAVNFNCNDCSGQNHDLFAELDAGKVIVICWVMPCGSCVGPALTTYNVVQSFANSYPDKVYLYLVDDYANTSCTSLDGWSKSNGINGATLFSNEIIDMTDYGTAGMPKVVVVGDVNHAVFYNANNSVNATALQDAILTAINATTTSIREEAITFSSPVFFPNPSSGASTVTFIMGKSSTVTIGIFDQAGRKVLETQYTGLTEGENKIGIRTSGLDKGMYFLKMSNGTHSRTIKIALAD
jgi:hypothetical protein